ncbi:hypothetical protein PENTCL1PPCAC_1004, partial [Pristionchus entomophagus]
KQDSLQQGNPAMLDLVTKLTKLKYEERPSFDEIYNHSFFNTNKPMKSSGIKFADLFTVDKILGIGKSDIVVEVTSYYDDLKYAVKRFSANVKPTYAWSPYDSTRSSRNR